MKVNLKIRKTTKREKVDFIVGLLLLLFMFWYFMRQYMSVDIEAIRWLLDNATAYAISKNCGVSTQAVDKYKNGVSDIMNMRLKHAINMTNYAYTLKEKQ